MNSNSPEKLFNQNDNILCLNNNQKKNKYKVINSSKSNKKGNQDKNNLKYFSKIAKDSLNDKNIKYLATENNEKSNDFFSINQKRKTNGITKKKIIKKKKSKNRILLPQKSIEFHIQKGKFKFLINSPNKNEDEKNPYSDNNRAKKSNNSVHLNSINDMIYHENKNNIKNIKNDFISTTKNILDTSTVNKKKRIGRSFSVDNYYDILNNSFSNYTDNLDNIKNSKIFDKNFFNRIRNPKRKNNLIKMLEKYHRFKSFSGVKIKDPLNNSFKFLLGFDRIEQNKYRQKSIEKLYNIKKIDNIILEDENENSENDNSKKNDNINNNNINNKNDKQTQKENIINFNINFENVEKLKKKKNIEKNKKNEINNKSIDTNINNRNKGIKKSIEINHEIKIKKDVNCKNKSIYIDVNSKYFDKKNFNQNISYEKYNKNIYNNKIIGNNIKEEKKDNNNDLNSKINFNINNLNNKMNNNIRKNNIIIKSKKPKFNPQKILVRKILREERYIIDENGQEQVLEINQSLVNDNNDKNIINKKSEIYLKQINNRNKNNYNNLDEEIIKKERYHRNNKNILNSYKYLDFKNNLQKKNIKNKNDYSFNISNKISIDKIKRNSTIISPIYKISQNNTTRNSIKKENEIIQNLKFSKLNKPIIIKKMDKLLQINSPNSDKYRNININNNLNNVLYIQNRTSPNSSIEYGKYEKSYHILKNEYQRKSENNINKNHSYHEITSFNNRKIKSSSKTIYHDYNNLDKRIILNKSSLRMNNNQNNFKENNNFIIRNYSSNNIQKPFKINRGLFLERMIKYNKNENNKLKKKIIIDNSMEKNYKVYNNKNNADDPFYSRKENMTQKLKKDNFIDYTKNRVKGYTNMTSSIKYSNSITNRSKIHDSFNKYENNSQNMINRYHSSNNSFKKNLKMSANSTTKNNYSINGHIFYKFENRKKNILNKSENVFY